MTERTAAHPNNDDPTVDDPTDVRDDAPAHHRRHRPRRRALGVGTAAAVVFAAVVFAAVVRLPVAPAGADSTGAGAGGGSVTVGAGSGQGSGGTGGSSGGSGGTGGGSGSGGSGSPWTCTYTYLTLNNEGGFPPGGAEPGAWYSVTCVDLATSVQVTQTIWVTSNTPVPAPAVDPRALALQAENSIHLPHPAISLDPTGTSVVNLATWFWIDPDIWHEESVTAAAGAVSATAVARPVDVRWNAGDGGTVVCQGPGVPYDTSLPSAWQSTSCSYEYAHSSAGQPTLDGNPDDGMYVVTATVDWEVSWTSTGVAGGGALPTLQTSSAALLRVAQVESVNTTTAVIVHRRTPRPGGVA